MGEDVDERKLMEQSYQLITGRKSFEEILENVQKRDYIDSNRKESPLLQAPDAYFLDNSDLTKEAQMQIILDLVKEKI